MKAIVFFIEDKVKQRFYSLEHGTSEERHLFSMIQTTINNIKENPFSGFQVPKKQIPKIYLRKFGIDNLWKIDLASSWRLVYSVASNDDGTIALIIEWFDHQEYERRFRY